MVTRITRVLLIVQLLCAAVIGAAVFSLWNSTHAVAAFLTGIGIVLLFRLLITSNNFFITWMYRSETPARLRIDWRQACRMYLGEFRATMLSSSWTMPFHRFTKRVAIQTDALPVLLIHGYGCNSGYWHSMSKALTKASITHFAIDLEPIFLDIDGYATLIDRAVDTVCKETGQEQIIIVAHSMGGLATRAYLRDYGIDRIARVITLGTPHHGTCLANFGAGSNSKQMCWSGNAKTGMPCPWLQELAGSENHRIRSRFVSIYSHHDNIVSPQTSAHLPGATNIEFGGIGHVALALHPVIQQSVIDHILTIPLVSSRPYLKSA